ncbi:ferredoxin-thioredoxin reductase variable chain [Leptolyngbya sp. FACHB-36]|uniref:ferredoxin-thioredoxin reductase variable chain n=1 Tax=Leptolyngbya sp. FACHB-36 TaxID=2692808 RepID=UPI001680BFFB|nr:ferredoxin-thioredoxin reductase variable chain [Leptolyngbya sp. FACHB-36]MBD2022788.1 ferredoxin-thioredoxin reductase variable chain [Leptolyngbya sp. FACHB-36]
MQAHDEAFPVGSRVRVAKSVVVYHHPEHRNQPFDIQGTEGEVIDVIRELNGRPISANFPVVVKFGAKFRSHLQEGELELLS